MYANFRTLHNLLGCMLCVVLLQSLSVARQAYPQTEETDQVDRLFATWDKKDSPGAAIGIIKDGRIIYARGYGMANLEYDIPNTPQSVFRIGSTSKHFTAMGIALLIEQGKISLDDNIRLYLPELPAYEWPIEVRHLLHHTSGLRNYEVLMMLAGRDGDTYKVPYYTDEEALQMIARQKEINFEPGERYSYSNSNYFLLAEIIGRVSKMKTSEFFRQFVFEPLGMSDTHFHDDVSVIVKNRASGYSPAEDGGFRINMTQLEQIGTGSIYTTIEDFYRWDQNFYNNKLGNGSQSLIEMVETPGTLNNGESANYGFGLNVTSLYGLRTIGHGGSFVGYRSYYLRFPDQRFSIIVLANQGPFPDYEIVREIALIYLNDQFTEPVEVAQSTYRDGTDETDPDMQTMVISSELRAQYLGTYYSEELDATYTLFEDDNSLLVRVGRYYTTEIRPSTPDKFPWVFGELEFKRDSGDSISGFTLHMGPIQNIKFTKMSSL